MAGNIGFVFDGTTAGNGTYSPNNGAMPYPPPYVTQPPHQPFTPTEYNGYNNYYGQVQPPPPPFYPDSSGLQDPSPSYHQQYSQDLDHNRDMMRGSHQEEAFGYGHGQHGKGGIPGGKLGVVGGAVVAGAGTALAMQLLPKKMKKNKLVKYGLPLAGAGAAGYKLNQMNQQGKHH